VTAALLVSAFVHRAVTVGLSLVWRKRAFGLYEHEEQRNYILI